MRSASTQPEGRLAPKNMPAPQSASSDWGDIRFAMAIVGVLTILFVPLPSILIDFGLALSIALAILILMVALWIEKPLEFSAFPTILLIATLLRLSLNIATTRLILQNGAEGHEAAGYVISGFANFVMAGDFVIGVIVFAILLTVNFVVITKGASRIAEVGARFSLDAMPGKQMAIDADLSAGLIDEAVATTRRRELEEESAFFGAMDGASKFVRGDAIAGVIITGVNSLGGVVIGVFRHGLSLSQALDVYTKLSVGDGLVTQIPALIVSLAAGLLVSKGGTRGAIERTVVGQLSHFPNALKVSGVVMAALALSPGLPLLPFGLLAAFCWSAAATIKSTGEATSGVGGHFQSTQQTGGDQTIQPASEYLRTSEIELRFGRQLSAMLVRSNNTLTHRVAKMRRNFARQYGFVIPEIKVSDNLDLPPKQYEIAVHGTVVSSAELRLGEVLVVLGDGPAPDGIVGDEIREPAFGMKAKWAPEMFANDLRGQGFSPVDATSVLLTHLGEILRSNLGRLLSYKDFRKLLDHLEPEYKRLTDEICPAHISHSSIQAVLKMLLAERISIRNIHLILEAIAEVAPFTRKIETITEHVRSRIAPQICGDIAQDGVLKLLRLGSKWELAFHKGLRKDPKGEIVEFDVDPRQIEQFSSEASTAIRNHIDQGQQFAIVCATETRPYIRMVLERMFPTLPILSHSEIARSIEVRSLGSIA